MHFLAEWTNLKTRHKNPMLPKVLEQQHISLWIWYKDVYENGSLNKNINLNSPETLTVFMHIEITASLGDYKVLTSA